MVVQRFPVVVMVAIVIAAVGFFDVGVNAMRPRAQAPAPVVAAKFEVVSIKRKAKDDDRETGPLFWPGRFEIINRPLIDLFPLGFGPPGDEVIGAPAWLTTERYTVVAKIAGVPTRPQAASMFRDPLATRFGLVSHLEKRLVSTWVLSVARQDRTLGPRIRRRAAPCPKGTTVVLGLVPGHTDSVECGSYLQRPNSFSAAGVSMSLFSDLLSILVPGGRHVDQTGLDGTFDVDLEFSSPRSSGWLSNLLPTSAPEPPSIFDALRDELGLTLESKHVEADVVVIDHVDRPTPD